MSIYADIISDYESYVRKQKPSKDPDLAIAFDTGAAQHADKPLPTYDEDVFPWIAPMKFLVSRKIPCLFTVRMTHFEILSALFISSSLQTYNEQEATVEGDMLKKAGADLHPLFGPRENPWGSLLLRMEPCSLSDFYSHNGWLSGGIRQHL